MFDVDVQHAEIQAYLTGSRRTKSPPEPPTPPGSSCTPSLNGMCSTVYYTDTQYIPMYIRMYVCTYISLVPNIMYVCTVGEVKLPTKELFSCGISHILTPASFYIQRNGSEFAVRWAQFVYLHTYVQHSL